MSAMSQGPAQAWQPRAVQVRAVSSAPLGLSRPGAATVLLVGLAVCAGLAGCASGSTPVGEMTAQPSAAMAAGPEVLPGEPWIVYQKGGQNSLLRLVRPDGSDDHNLARHPLPGAEAHPAWSPDGQRIAFDVAADSPGGPPHSSIWVADAIGVDAREIAACELPCRQLAYPAWSPDGHSIAMTRYDLNPDGDWGPSAVEVVDVDSGQRRVIIQTPDGTSAYYQPDWSPDGSSLVVSVETYPDARQASVTTRTVAVLRADGSDPAPMIISDPADFAIEPDWGPTNRIVYAVTPTPERVQPSDLVTTDADGSNPARIAATAVGLTTMFDPDWTQDSTRIQVTTADEGSARQRLATMAPDGTAVQLEPWYLTTASGGPWATHPHLRPERKDSMSPTHRSRIEWPAER